MQILSPAYLDAIVKYSVEKYDEPRIVGGDEVVPNSVPHQAALKIDQTYFCGGKKMRPHSAAIMILLTYGLLMCYSSIKVPLSVQLGSLQQPIV